jgi:hypothetical protein
MLDGFAYHLEASPTRRGLVAFRTPLLPAIPRQGGAGQ